MNLASFLRSRHTRNMGIPRKRGLLFLAVCALAIPAAADEIRLKDGKKLYGTIVAYEDNMFKVKTEFGYVLVEKDKIAEIIPASPKPEPKPTVKKEVEPKAGKPAIEPAKATEKLEAAKERASPATAPAAALPQTNRAICRLRQLRWRSPQLLPLNRRHPSPHRIAKKFKATRTSTTRTAFGCTRRRAGT